jgi:hypothetical protein
MAGSDLVLTGSRIANATRAWQAVEDADVTGWDADDFIFAAMVETAKHGGVTVTLQLRWRNVTDSGTFTALSGSGELTWSATTDLVNDNALTSGEAGCTPIDGTTWDSDDGLEREGANDVAAALAQDEYVEFHWGIDASGRHAGDQYEFEIYDATAGASLGTCAAQITMQGPTTYTRTVDLDAYLKKIFTKTLSLDALLTETGLEKTVSADAFLQRVALVTTSLDSVLQKFGLTISSDLDSLLQALGVEKTSSLDAFLAKVLSQTLSLDAILITSATVTKTLSIDALLNEVGLTVSASIDSFLQSVGVSVSASLDSFLQATITLAASLDAILISGAAPGTLSAYIDACLTRTGIAKSLALDAILASFPVVGLDAILAARSSYESPFSFTMGQGEREFAWPLSHDAPEFNLSGKQIQFNLQRRRGRDS